MIILIAGDGHTGKTLLAQRLLEKYAYPYLSIDHLKMGLMRSGNTALTPESDEKALTEYLWRIVREMIKTCIENRQNLIVEGCYIPFDFANDFTKDYLKEIRYVCLVFSKHYIREHFSDIVGNENVIEHRVHDGDLSIEQLISSNMYNLKNCQRYGLDYILVDNNYDVDYDI